MRVKKALIWLLALLMLCAAPAMAEDDELRGYLRGHGWKFVSLGQYPYEKDGTVEPVVWRVLSIENNQALLYNVHIAGYDFGNRFNHNTKQVRRLLLHKREILKLSQWLGTKGGTIIPLRFYLHQGLVKVEIAYCQGKTHADQRETLRRRETEKDIRRLVKK